jgi:hypothetical protein
MPKKPLKAVCHPLENNYHNLLCMKCYTKDWNEKHPKYYDKYTPEKMKKIKEDLNANRKKAALFKQNNPERILIYAAKDRAKRNGIPFNITHKDIQIPHCCPFLGIKIFPGVGKMTDNSPTLDRIQPDLGYTKGNVLVISNRANRLKNNATLEELELIVAGLKRVANA